MILTKNNKLSCHKNIDDQSIPTKYNRVKISNKHWWNFAEFYVNICL